MAPNGRIRMRRLPLPWRALIIGLAVTGGVTGAGLIAAGSANAIDAPATAANCTNSGSGYTAVNDGQQASGTYHLEVYQVWDKQNQNCTDFYITQQNSSGRFGGFYKLTSDPPTAWNLGAVGFLPLDSGSDGIEGRDLVTNLANGAQLNVAQPNSSDNYVQVAF